MIKLTAQLVWEEIVLPTIRFVIGYAPMIAGVAVAKEVTIQYFVTSMARYDIFLDWLAWYIPAILVMSLAFGVMATKSRRIHPVGIVLMLVAFLLLLKMGVSEMQISMYFSGTPTIFESLVTSVSAVASVYCIALMVQRAWANILPKRKK